MASANRTKTLRGLQKMNILSLFDGMSCGQIALERAGLYVENYYASEIDKYAIKVANHNYPDMINLGSVIDLTEQQLLKLPKIDMLIGGSPCQGFSVSGKMKGSSTACGIDVTNLNQYLKLKEEKFEFEGQSYLIWEYVRVWKILKPKYFFLENVRVTKKWLPMFNEAMGVEPIMINSALVSAQNRVRFYWTNIPNLTQPEDKGILLKDILEKTGRGVVKNRGELKDRNIKSLCIDANYFKGADNHGQRTLIIPEATKKGFIEVENGDCFDYAVPNSKTRRGRNMKDKSNALLTSNAFMRYEHPTYRKLITLECERLQTVPEKYTSIVSNSQAYKMLGNGWTIDVIVHIFKNLNQEPTPPQKSLMDIPEIKIIQGGSRREYLIKQSELWLWH